MYQRIETELDDTLKVEMDETDTDKLTKLAEKASYEFQTHGNKIIDNYCKY